MHVAMYVRTYVHVRVSDINFSTYIETLLSAEGRKLRNSLFCLKRMFQVRRGVLDCVAVLK